MDYTRKSTYPAAGMAGMPNAVDYGEANLKAQAYQSQKCEQVKPASELMADIYNTVAAQERALRVIDDLSNKIFGPSPECEKSGEIHADYITALIARSRRLAVEIADRLEGLNANI